MLTIPGEKTDAAPRVVPMTQKFREFMLRMKGGNDLSHDVLVIEVREASVSLAGPAERSAWRT